MSVERLGSGRHATAVRLASSTGIDPPAHRAFHRLAEQDVELCDGLGGIGRGHPRNSCQQREERIDLFPRSVAPDAG
jgi:protein-tyrosine-phosphatase